MLAAAALLLAAGLFHHHHPKTQPSKPALLQQDLSAADMESSAAQFSALLQADNPNIPQVYFDSITADLEKLALESAADPGFAKDLDNLTEDVKALNRANTYYVNMDMV